MNQNTARPRCDCQAGARPATGASLPPGLRPQAPPRERRTFHDNLLTAIPLHRVGEVTDVAGAVVFLASPAASLITGTTS